MSGIAQVFPPTSWDLLAEAARRDAASPAALNEFADRYYAAIRAYMAAVVRGAADADDLAQRFFETVVLSGRLFDRADRHKGQFRPYLKQAIRNFLVDERRRGARTVNTDVRPDGSAEGWNAIVSETSPAPDEELLRAWGRSVVAMAIRRLEAACGEHGQAEHFQLFARRCCWWRPGRGRRPPSPTPICSPKPRARPPRSPGWSRSRTSRRATSSARPICGSARRRRWPITQRSRPHSSTTPR